MTEMCRKTFPALILFSTFLVFLSGCGFLGIGSDSGSSNKTSVSWLVRSTDKGLTVWEKQTAKDFETAHPNIHVNIISVPSANYDQKLITMNAGGTPPDVFSQWGSNSWVDWTYRGLVADLTPYVKSTNTSFDGMNASLLQQYKVNGKLYGIPFSTGGSYVFYNVDLFKQANLPMPPTSWSDPNWNEATFMHDAQALTQASGQQFGLSNDLWPEDAIPQLFGGDIFPESAYSTGVIDHTQANSPQVQEAVQWQHVLTYKYKVAPTQSEASTIGNGFMSGKIGMSMIGVWGFWVDQPATFHYAAAPLPNIKDNKDVVFTDPWMMAKGSKHPSEAWTFIQWLTDPAHGEKSYIQASGAVPPWKQLLPDWAQSMHKFMPSLSTNQLVELAQGSLDHGQESINHRAIGYGQYDSVIGNVLGPVFTDQKDTQSALNDLQTQLTQTIKQNGPTHPLS